MRPPLQSPIARIGVRQDRDEPDAVVGPRPRGSRRLHTDAKVAGVRRLVEQTTLTYGEIAQRTGVGRASICRWTREGGWQRPAFAPRATNTVPTARAGARLRLRTLAARLAALAEHHIRELEDSACVDPDKLGEALDLKAEIGLTSVRPRAGQLQELAARTRLCFAAIDDPRREPDMTRAWHWSLIAALILVAAAPTDAAAQSDGYPNKPVRFISDSAAGSSPDVGLRIVAEGLAQLWGQQVVVENRPGASGAISARAAAEATPDGYTLYAPALSTFLALPGRAPNLPLVLPRDFIPIGFTFDQPMSIGASPTLGVNTLPELIALAKTKPGEITYSVAGVGRMTHLTGELLQIRGDIKLQVIPYTGGAAQALSDIVAGRISMIVEGYAGMAGIYQAGTLKPLAVGSAQRLEEAPQIPTVAETLPGFVAAGWQVVVAPNGTPEAVVRKVSADLRQVLTKPDMVSRLSLRGSYPRVMTAAETEAFVREQQQLWKPAMERIAGQTN